MKNLFLIIATVFVCVSCGDVIVIYELNIDNRTNDIIRIRFSEKSPYHKIFINPDSLIFLPQSKKFLYVGEGYPSKNGCDYTGILKDQVEVEVYSGKVLTKEIWDVSNWDCVGSFKDGWVQTFVITEEDLSD